MTMSGTRIPAWEPFGSSRIEDKHRPPIHIMQHETETEGSNINGFARVET